MKILTPVSFILAILSQKVMVNAQLGDGSCSGTNNNFDMPSKGSCMLGWDRGNAYKYPDQFSILNDVKMYTCEQSGKRIIISNGIPDHDVTQGNPNTPCAINWAVSIPLNPTIANSNTELPTRGAIAIALNGVPAYGPQEGGGTNANEPDPGSPVQDAKFWYGHADKQKAWHFHNPYMGTDNPDDNTLLGYAFDGFPIYGPLNDSSQLDACNGIEKNGKYQYHVVKTNQVDESKPYCNGRNPENNWNYIIGCYSGSISSTQVLDSTTFELPSDCTTSECVDTSDGFFYKMKEGNPVLKTCDWLAGKSSKAALCRDRVAYYQDGSDIHSPPQVVCQATCESCDACYENAKSRFFAGKKNGKVKTKTCFFLAKKSDKRIRKLCRKDNSGEGYGPAKKHCPVTCGVDSCGS